jgi:pimeloyl-ACP methyl ester carboxylesterase
MVGHSLGAYETLRFTDLHRHSVVGMVFVDPTIPDQTALLERLAPLFFTKAHGQAEKQLQDCAAELRSGTLNVGTPEFEQCTAANGVPADFPRMREVIARLNADPDRLLTEASTSKEWDGDDPHDSREAMNAQRRYGNMPLIVLTAGRDEAVMLQMFGNDTPEELAQLRKQVEQFLQDAWVPGHDAYAALSTRGRNQVIDSGHGIQREKPEVVISAVIEVLDEIRPSALHEP